MKLQRLGGYAAIASAPVFASMALLVLQLGKHFGSLNDPARFKAAVSAAAVYFCAVPILLIVNIILWQIMFFTLYECLRNRAPQLTRIFLIAASSATALSIAAALVTFGTTQMSLQPMVPIQDVADYMKINEIVEGALMMAGAHFYGWAFLLTGWAILRAHLFSKIPGWLFVAAGLLCIPGFIFYRPALVGRVIATLTAVWIGIALLREKQLQSALEKTAVS
jgi:hypothetical protein